MFVDPIAGWRRVSNRPQRTRLDWAEEIKQLLDKDYPEAPMIKLVLDGRNKASISTAQWFAFVSPFERFRHCTIEVLYKV